MATIQSEVESAGLAAAFGLEGKVRFSLVPEQGRVDIATELVDVVPAQGVLIDAATLASEAMAARRAFSAYLRQLADRALKRYDKPVGIAPDWRADAEFVLSVAR